MKCIIYNFLLVTCICNNNSYFVGVQCALHAGMNKANLSAISQSVCETVLQFWLDLSLRPLRPLTNRMMIWWWYWVRRSGWEIKGLLSRKCAQTYHSIFIHFIIYYIYIPVIYLGWRTDKHSHMHTHHLLAVVLSLALMGMWVI